MTRRVGAILALLVASTVIGLIVVEGGMRTVACVNRHGLGMNRRDRYVGWSNRPNVRTTVQRCVGGQAEFRASVRTNRWGFRGDDVAERPTPDVPRFLVLGDSFTHGAQVDDDALFTTKLAQRLVTGPHGVPVEVLNAGVNGWSTDNAVAYFEREGWRFQPDVVLLVFDTTNDVYENAHRMVGMRGLYADKPYFELEDGRLQRRNYPLAAERPRTTWAREVAGRLALGSAAFSLVMQQPSILRLLVLPGPLPPPDGVDAALPEVMLRTYPPHWTEAWRITRGLLLRLRRSVEAHGARLVVVVATSCEEVSPDRLRVARIVYPRIAGADLDPDKPNRLVMEFLTRRGIPAISLLEPFRARFSKDGTPGFYRTDIHWSPAGHALAAEMIAEGLHAFAGARPTRTAPAAAR